MADLGQLTLTETWQKLNGSSVSDVALNDTLSIYAFTASGSKSISYTDIFTTIRYIR